MDWPERRLTQYTTSHGAGQPDGGTFSALTPDLTARYAALASDNRAASQAEIAALLDGHHFIFHLLAAQSLLDALPDPASSAAEQVAEPGNTFGAASTDPRDAPQQPDPRTAELRSNFATLT